MPAQKRIYIEKDTDSWPVESRISTKVGGKTGDPCVSGPNALVLRDNYREHAHGDMRRMAIS